MRNTGVPRTCVALAALLAALMPAGMAQPPAAPTLPSNTVTVPAPPPEEGDRVVVTGMVPVPDVGEGAPYYQPDDITIVQKDAREDEAAAERFARKCGADPGAAPDGFGIGAMFVREAEAARMIANLAVAARNATLAAEDARSKAARGAVDMKVVEQTELARQTAVNAFDKAREEHLEAKSGVSDVLWLMQKKTPPEHFYTEIGRLENERRKAGGARAVRPALELADLEFADIGIKRGADRKGRFVYVTGKIVNTRTKAISVPAITVTLVDKRGFPLESKVAEKKYAPEIPAGGFISFTYEFRPAHMSAETVTVSFASKDSGATRLPPRMFPECQS